jgi:hypothetical protein
VGGPRVADVHYRSFLFDFDPWADDKHLFIFSKKKDDKHFPYLKCPQGRSSQLFFSPLYSITLLTTCSLQN